ncbi:MAG: cytochrome P460 family protein [Terriglobia bacterium]
MTSRARLLLLGFVAVAAAAAVLYAQAPKKTAIAYPEGYRKWIHVKSMVIFSKENKLFERFGGMHNIYVNELGWKALRVGSAFPDGATFVFDLYDVRTYQGAIEARGRKFLAVMKKNAKLYPNTGGWGFEVFKGYEQAGSLNDMNQCFSCHSQQKRRDYVFSEFAE